MANPYEAPFAETPVIDRRGVWTSFDSPEPWEALLVREDDASSLARCDLIASTEPLPVDEVLSGVWQPPPGRWALAVRTASTPWVTVVPGGYDKKQSRIGWGVEESRDLLIEYPGQVLFTGYLDEAGLVFVERYEAGRRVMQFENGPIWSVSPAEPDDGAAVKQVARRPHDRSVGSVRLVVKPEIDLPADWVDTVDTAEEAHQSLIRHFDAYVPYYEWDPSGLSSYHDAADTAEYVTGVDLLTIAD